MSIEIDQRIGELLGAIPIHLEGLIEIWQPRDSQHDFEEDIKNSVQKFTHRIQYFINFIRSDNDLVEIQACGNEQDIAAVDNKITILLTVSRMIILNTKSGVNVDLAQRIKELHSDLIDLEFYYRSARERAIFRVATHSGKYLTPGQLALETQIEAFNLLHKELQTLKSNLSKDSEEFKSTVDFYKEKKPLLELKLEEANQAGLAKSFKSRALQLQREKRTWLLSFAGILIILFSNGLLFLYDYFSLGKTPIELIVRGIVSLPLIWGGWFSVKQFGYASRLQEDYEFKVSTSMGFEGYKQAAKDIDKDLEKKLLATAIHTFADNPLRIYSIPSDPGTPAQEIFESLSKLEKIASVVKRRV